MKRKFLALAAACAVLAVSGCNNTPAATSANTTAATTIVTKATTTTAPATAETTTADNTDADAEVLTHAEYIAANIDDPVTVETYVQGKQGWWEDNGVGKASFYAQNKSDDEGGYFFYEMPCSKEEYDKIVPGTKLRVSGFKAEWSGEIEIIDSTFEILSGDNYIAEAKDVTSLLGTDGLADSQNEFVAFKGMTVEAQEDGSAFFYKWDNSGSQGDDLYFKVSDGSETYTFTVESYLCGKDTDVYKAVEALSVGDRIDMEGFLYWYNGANPHITSVAPAAASAMTHTEYIAANVDDPVTVETYVQGKQGWWEENGVGQASFYAQNKIDDEGGYFFYNMPCSKEDYDKIVPGTKLRVSGYKAEWSGEVEIIDSTFEIIPGDTYIASAKDVTALLGSEGLVDSQNEFVAFKGMTVEAQEDGSAFFYKWDNSGSQGDDLYFKVSDGTNTYTFTVESYLCGKDTDVYKAVEGLSVGDKINMEGFLYWYNGANPHITSVVKA